MSILRFAIEAEARAVPDAHIWHDINEWVALTGEDKPADAAPGPVSISATQFIRGAHTAGMLGQIDAAVAQADALTQELWKRSPTFSSADPTVLAMGAALGLAPEQIRDLFAAWSAL